MKCQCCDKMLSDYEATRKNAETGQYLDLCQDCLDDVMEQTPIAVKDNPALLRKHNSDEDFYDEGY